MRQLLLALAQDIVLAQAVDYLYAMGWRRIEHPNHKIQVLQLIQPETEVKIVLPRSEQAPDLVLRLIETAEILGEIQGLTPEIILDRMRFVAADVVRTRIIGAMAHSSTLPLESASRMVSGLKGLITHGASAEDTKLPFLSRATKKGVLHGRHCRFGHTFNGSFGFTIESPVISTGQQALSDDVPPPPFERRVIERVYRGIGIADRAVGLKTIDPIVAHYEVGLNANMCEALASMWGKNDALSIEYTIQWSPKVATRSSILDYNSICLGPEVPEYLELV